MNFAILASGKGTNLQAIFNALKQGKIKARLAVVISDRKDAFALKRAQRAKIKSVFVNPEDFPDREAFDGELLRVLKREKVGLVVLAGFMRILSPQFIRKYHHQVINIHPALLPAYKGAHAIADCFHDGAKMTGVTVHFADEKVDHGPIILQEALEVRRNETLAGLEARIHKIEHRIYPKAIDLFVRGKLKIRGRKVEIRN